MMMMIYLLQQTSVDLGRGNTLYACVYMHVFVNREHVKDSHAFSGGMHLRKSHMHI